MRSREEAYRIRASFDRTEGDGGKGPATSDYRKVHAHGSEFQDLNQADRNFEILEPPGLYADSDLSAHAFQGEAAH